MIRSMTGFGRGEAQSAGYRFLVEIRSVNHRFLNAHVRLSREFAHLESALAGRCAARCDRGHLDIRLEVERDGGADGAGPRLNRAVLDRFLEIADALAGAKGVRGGIEIGALLSLPGVVDAEPEPIALGDRAFLAGAGEALDAALAELVAGREAEGRALEADFRERLAAIERWRSEIALRAPEREARERDRLREKVVALIGHPDETLDWRIAQEVVLLADRMDVTEELIRIRAHLDHLEAELDGSGGAVGRKMTFLLQELVREANTVSAKANDPVMQQAAIEIKAELEKMREQAENVE
ncbi:MAG TPA: YicC/YloC family endoribonuclease [Gemmatimonadota bacterium]|nr:YicC/YloC family endoribonuclease [Gemmatimonadota bacterium]